MMKNTDGQNHDTHNYWHHFGNFNWDLPNRWWAQIAGDCVDLNTENNTVAEYLVKCYGNFIKMGVDGFRIDTSGHISRLTFCKQFIPQFAALGKQYEDKRLNKAPFFMYGEVCARFGSVQYRGQDNLSPYYYTWNAPQNLMDQFDGSQSYWDTQEIYDSGTGYDAKLMPLCEKDNADSPESNNTFMLNGAWHEPDYSQSSGFNVIDFPLHYNFSNAGSAYGLAKSGDMKYNDATFNVVYVDSHDYGPQPNDGVRFGGSDAQWAENLSLMFTFRGIPCLYYGSEIGFKRGAKIDNGPNGPLSDTGRAYFGGYITGDVTATDFGEYKASGNVDATLNHDLAQHLIRLNKIRQAVPALRKGQWTDEGCTPAKGGIAFKRAYKDSYALVALNGGATFTDCPAGTYTDLVTGKTYTGSTITVDAPNTQGQVRVLVKDWKGGKLIDDGAFIYETAAQHKGGQTYDGNQEAGTTWVDEAPLQPVSVSLSPAGGSFRTNTVTVTATLSEDAESGWYQIEGQNKVDLTPGEAATFTIGDDMDFNQTKTVTWSATSSEGEKTGKVTYTKVDPNAAITVYVKADKAPYIHAWITGGKNLTGEWPGKVMDGPVEIDGAKYWTYDFDNVESFNVILNNGSGAQSGEISGITGDTYLEYDGSTSAKKIDAPVNTVATAKVTLSPNGGDFQKTISVTATLSNNAKSGWYKIGDGEQVALTPGKATTFTLGDDMQEGESKTVTWSATNADNETKTGSATFNKKKEVVIPTPTGIFAYFLAPSDWTDVHAYVWNGGDEYAGKWPGVACTKTGEKKNGLDIWMWKYDGDTTELPANIIFNNNGNGNNQTGNFEFVNGAVYNRDGKTNESVSTGINQTVAAQKAGAVKIYTLSGVKVAEVSNAQDAEYILAPGAYICNGKKFVIK